MNPTDLAIREAVGKDAQRDAIHRVVERGHDHDIVGDVEVRVARRQPLTPSMMTGRG